MYGVAWYFMVNCTYLVDKCPYLDNQSLSVLLQQAIRVDYVKTFLLYYTFNSEQLNSL